MLKSLVKDKFQIAVDLSWQHYFQRTYNQIYGVTVQTSYTKGLGDRFNYGLSLKYLINHWSAVSLSAGGYSQGAYRINDIAGENSNEFVTNFTVSYTYYPLSIFRITPSIKWFIPAPNIGKNSTGSYLFTLNCVYYLENNDDY